MGAKRAIESSLNPYFKGKHVVRLSVHVACRDIWNEKMSSNVTLAKPRYNAEQD